jgi:hypothetical protein
LGSDYKEASRRATAVLLWFLIVVPTLTSVRTTFLLSESPSDPAPFAALEMLGLIAIGFAFLSYRISRRLRRGAKVKFPYFTYLGIFLLAMFLAEFIYVFGMVYVLFGVSPWAALLFFFAPAWLLFLMNFPSKQILRTWTHPGTS